MRVKIRDTWYNSNDESICIQLTAAEHMLIRDMDSSTSPERKFAAFPEEDCSTPEEREEWMEG